MKILLYLSALCFLKLYINCTQSLWKFVPEHCELTNINESLVHVNFGKCHKLSRSELYFNVSFYLKQDLLDNNMGQILITGYQFRSNEYRKGPIEFMLGMCSAMASKDFDIPNMLSISNVRCPLIKDRNYYIYNVSPNAINMPPLIPEGRWLVQIDLLYMNEYVMSSIKWYTGVEYPILFGR